MPVHTPQARQPAGGGRGRPPEAGLSGRLQRLRTRSALRLGLRPGPWPGLADGVVDPAEQAEARLAEGPRCKPFISRRFRAVGLNLVTDRLKISPYSPGRRRCCRSMGSGSACAPRAVDIASGTYLHLDTRIADILQAVDIHKCERGVGGME